MMSNVAQVRVLPLTAVGAEQRLNELMSIVSPNGGSGYSGSQKMIKGDNKCITYVNILDT